MRLACIKGGLNVSREIRAQYSCYKVIYFCFFVDYMAYEDIGLFIYIYFVVYVLKTFALTD